MCVCMYVCIHNTDSKIFLQRGIVYLSRGYHIYVAIRGSSDTTTCTCIIGNTMATVKILWQL